MTINVMKPALAPIPTLLTSSLSTSTEMFTLMTAQESKSISLHVFTARKRSDFFWTFNPMPGLSLHKVAGAP